MTISNNLQFGQFQYLVVRTFPTTDPHFLTRPNGFALPVEDDETPPKGEDAVEPDVAVEGAALTPNTDADNFGCR